MPVLLPDFEQCYRAMRSRDARFDGHFFTAVTTTGIYCRPICPAPAPLAQHVRFYPCAAAAEAAGFRACRRCHPEASPGSPAWNLRADLVNRALRMIADGVVDTDGVAGLARRLAVSERHLHRELVTSVGVGPLALARTRRTQTARLLIEQTDLSLATIAFTAGFASIRRFNAAMHATFGCVPSAFRRHSQPGSQGAGKLTLRLPYRPPFDVDSVLAYLGRRAIPGVEEFSNGRYRRTVQLPGSSGIIELEPLEQAHALRLQVRLSDLCDLSLLVQRCRFLFDLDAVPAAVAEVLGKDVLLAPLVALRPGLRVPGTVNGFEVALQALLGQHRSVEAARTLSGRLAAAFGTPLEQPEGTLTHLFPSPQALAQADLQGQELSRRDTSVVRALASAVDKEELLLDYTADRPETIASLLKLPEGAGAASLIAMRVLGDPDAFPLADRGLQQALRRFGLASEGDCIERRAAAWRPWRAYAAQYLWRSPYGAKTPPQAS